MAETGRKIRFTKMTGSGNDFIIIDNRGLKMDKERGRELALFACRRKVSAGADGLILIEEDPEADFRWLFFNSDGSEAEMCGNGARCAARFAWLNGIVDKKRLSFRTLAGIIEAEILGERVKVRMTQPHGLETDVCIDVEDCPLCLNFINTGVPHVVVFAENETHLESCDVFGRGRAIRFHSRFQPAGSNANFAIVHDAHHMAIRTYERGVEAETLACGTGSIAAALVAGAKNLVRSPVDVRTRSGESLVIYFEKSTRDDKMEFFGVYLEGDARVVYEAELWDETLRR